ncbi:MAG: hypothetical protein A2046_02100 [Bacteroidetes bacterium GWA2_30_7]|nr:MAG: hypothetical protein A2046_02100 [Bacteroidetes bacterium GWA2_30_7]
MEEKFENLISLTISCLLDKPLNDCPFCKIRKNPLIKRISIINQMESSEKDKLYKHHIECYLKRVQKKSVLDS